MKKKNLIFLFFCCCFSVAIVVSGPSLLWFLLQNANIQIIQYIRYIRPKDHRFENEQPEKGPQHIHTLNISMCPFAMTMSYELNEREAQEKPQQGKSLSKFETGTGGHFGRMYTKTWWTAPWTGTWRICYYFELHLMHLHGNTFSCHHSPAASFVILIRHVFSCRVWLLPWNSFP